MTNADKIRTMTDEELAIMFDRFAGCEQCPAIKNRCGYGDACKRAWLSWLKEDDVREVVHGRWIDYDEDDIICSNCKEIWNI